MRAVRRNGWYLSGVTLIVLGVLLPLPRWGHLVFFALGLFLLLMSIGIYARKSGDWWGGPPEKLTDRTQTALAGVLIPLGIGGAGYLTAAITGHGLGPVHSSAQLDNGAQFGAGNSALIIALPLYSLALLTRPWIGQKGTSHLMTAVLVWAGYNVLGVIGFVVFYVVI